MKRECVGTSPQRHRFQSRALGRRRRSGTQARASKAAHRGLARRAGPPRRARGSRACSSRRDPRGRRVETPSARRPGCQSRHSFRSPRARPNQACRHELRPGEPRRRQQVVEIVHDSPSSREAFICTSDSPDSIETGGLPAFGRAGHPKPFTRSRHDHLQSIVVLVPPVQVFPVGHWLPRAMEPASQ